MKSIKYIIAFTAFSLALYFSGRFRTWAKEEQKSRTVTTVLSEAQEQEGFCPDEDYMDDHGNQYVLKSWRIEPIRMEGDEKTVKKRVIYRQVEGNESIPQTVHLLVEDEKSGKSAPCDIQLDDQKGSRERWVEGFSFPVVFHRYDARLFRLGEYMIPNQEEKPDLMGYEPVLLDMIGVSQAEYQISDIEWDGPAYRDESGELCRNARAVGKKLVRDYETVYSGSAQMPEYEALQCVAEYLLVKEESPKIRPIEKDRGPLPYRQELWKILKTIWMITVALALLIWIAAVAILLKKRYKETKQKDESRKDQ